MTERRKREPVHAPAAALRFFKTLFAEYRRDQCLARAGGLSFATLLALVPGPAPGVHDRVCPAGHPLGLADRATAAGLATLSIYLGILAAMVFTPMLALRYGMRGMLLGYGFAASAAAVLFLALARERAPDSPSLPMFEGLKTMLRDRNFLLLLVIFFIGLGLFNGVTTWIEAIVRPGGIGSAQAGLLGGAMLLGGILGAVIMPLLSDHLRRRKPFIILALFGLLPGLAGLSFAASCALLLASGCWFGFFLLSAGPIGFQYGAELTRPAPEGTSNSLLVDMGQIASILFIFAMDALPGGTTVSLLALMALAAAAGVLACLLRESPIRG
jgi:hypothetical protein